MSGSLRDQLMGLGFQAPATPKPEPRPSRPAPARGAPATGKPLDRAHSTKPHASRPHPSKPANTRPRGAGEMDLAKAFAIRAQKEKEERIEAERQKQEAAKLKREAKAKVGELLKDQALNDAGAEIARHFEYGGKIRRIYVSADQLKSLNAGELAVVQLDGRYLLVKTAIADAVMALLPSLLALRVDPDAPTADDPYADPRYQVPDDLVW